MSKSSIITACLVLTAIVSGCENNTYDGVHIAEGIDNVLTEYIEQHEKKEVISIFFNKIEDHVIMEIASHPVYVTPHDGCFRKQGRLFTYYSFRKSLADSLITLYDAKNRHVESKFKFSDSEEAIDDDYLGYCSYRVISKEQVREATKEDLTCKEKVTDKSGIKNAALNKVLNDWLNDNHVQLTSIKFFSQENRKYFLISNDEVYTKENLKGCLYRNGRMITFYSENDDIIGDFVDLEAIRKNLPLLSSYREYPKELAGKLFFGDAFFIKSRDSIQYVGVPERF